NVSTNKVIPTAYILYYTSDPNAASPEVTWTINPVIVCNDSNKLKLLFDVEPAAIDTIIVSPIARDVASTIEATIQDNPAGNTTFNLLSCCVAPRPYCSSRIVIGSLGIGSFC